MAGSRKWFVYVTDNSQSYAIERDESLTEAINAGTNDYPDTGINIDAIPRNIKPRLAIYESSDGRIRRGVVCLTQQIYGGVTANVPSIVDNGVNLTLRRLVGESRRAPIGIDTGLNDGDAT